MPTKRQRWPYGAEDARRESARLAEETKRQLRELERDLSVLLNELAPKVPQRYAELIKSAKETALRGQLHQTEIRLLLEEARNGAPNGTAD